MEVMVQEKALTPVEQTRLKALETIISENFLAYVAVGNALLEIRENKLYRTDEGRTWEGYCRQIWDMGHDYADRTVAAAKVVNNLLTIVSKEDGTVDADLLPANEAQARELAKLQPEQQKQVWQQLIEYRATYGAEDAAGKVTAKAVKNAVKRLKGEQITTGIQKALRDVKTRVKPDKNRQSAEFAQACEALMEQVEEERRLNWKNTPREVVFNALATLAEAVGECGELTMKDKKIAFRIGNVEKMLAAGFGIYRISMDKMFIEQMESVGTWVVYGEYEEATRGEEVFSDLLLEPMNIQA